MVRIVPNGIQVGQFVSPLIASEMTNGKIAPAKIRYEVRCWYPGGVIVKSDDEETGPGGLLKAGVPVHVEGEADPTEEEIARLVNAGTLGVDALGPKKESVADASDFVVPKTWEWGIDPRRRLERPRQAAEVCAILTESGRTTFLEREMIDLVEAQGSRLNTRQSPSQVFIYYKSMMIKSGFLVKRR